MRCNNLPSQLSTFIGREHEISTANRLLNGTRLLTLLGPGGCGKTRLALAVAEGLVRRYPDGVWFVDLASISEPDLAPQPVATALQLRGAPGRQLLDTLTSYLRSKRLLLLLDNCEHLIAVCADLTFALLTAAPGLRILATSREPLHVTGETTWPVPPLAMPKLEALPPVEELGRIEAVRLFVDRAARLTPGFTLTEQNALPISRICSWVAGSPLAIELAAARTRVLAPAQIADRLESAISLLATESRTVPARHRTLQATLDWSYNLLSQDEQAFFRRLSVFADSFSLAAAQAICGPAECGETPDAGSVLGGADGDRTLALLTSLVDRSLLEVESATGLEHRFRYLEPVRQYAAAKLVRQGEEPAARRSLLAWAVAFAQRFGPATYSVEARQSVDQLELELANLRAALRWAVDDPESAVQRHRLAIALSQFWQLRGYIREGVTWFEQLVNRLDDVPVRLQIDTLDVAAFLAIHARDFPRARRCLERGIRMSEQLDDRYAMAELYHRLCFLTFSEGNLAEAERLCQVTLPMFEQSGDKWGRAVILFYQANIAYLQLDYPAARTAALQSMELCRQLGFIPAFARRQVRLGQIWYAEGQHEQARACITDSLRSSTETGDNWGAAMGLAALSGIAVHERKHERAAWLLGVTEHLRNAFGAPLWLVDESEYDRNRAELTALLGPQAFTDAHEAGEKEARLDLPGALRKALDEPIRREPATSRAPRPSRPAPPVSTEASPLSKREKEVAALIAQGKSNAEIAAALFVGLRTVEAHVTHILNKLGFNSRAQIAAWTAAHSIAPSPEPISDRKNTR